MCLLQISVPAVMLYVLTSLCLVTATDLLCIGVFSPFLLIQQTLLPGVFSLVKVCDPTELAFLRASLEPRVRDGFQRMMDKFDSSFKFGGRM